MTLCKWVAALVFVAACAANGYAQTDQGKQYLKDLYNINGLATTTDAEYDTVRKATNALGLNLEQELAPR